MRTIVAAALLLALPVAGLAQTEHHGLPSRRAAQTIDQIIVQWRAGAPLKPDAKVARASVIAGVRLNRKRTMSSGAEVVRLERALDRAAVDSIIERLSADPSVEYAVADEWRYAHAIPSDPLFTTEQWYFRAGEAAATRAEHAWDVTTGDAATVVAVLDTGVRFEHPDLSAKLLPGFDFISSAAIANDGGGRDIDASDPGDWMTAQEAQQPPFDSSDCIPEGSDHVDSSWHGTRVASLIAAATNDAQGMAGSGWSTRILPVRVLGKCGGHDSDILDAMRWAAGISVFGAPTNATPAEIINLSLGAEGACSAAYRAAVSEITSRGVLIVASVGNDGGAVGAPANCPGVLGVTGLRHAGTKVGFSNLGPEAGIGAPGGNCVNTGAGQPCLFSITVATDAGTTNPTAPTHTDRINFNVGTSFSAPLVAGAAALMHAVNAQLSPAQYITLLRETAAPFATSSATTTTICQSNSGAVQDSECICTTSTCGAGMLNTHAAVLAAERPYAVLNAPATIDPSSAVNISAIGSFASNGRSVSAHQWSVLNVTGAAPTIADASQPSTTLQVGGASQFTLRVTVTDDQGAQDTADVTIATSTAVPPPASPPAPTPNPPLGAAPSSGGGGGGGGIGGDWLLALCFAASMRLLRRNQLRCELA